MSTASPPQRVRSTEFLKRPVVARIAGLNHKYADSEKKNLDNVHLQVHQGEIVFITGESGCGKTTLLTLLGALRSVQEGEVEVLGRPLHKLEGKELVEARRNIGFIFQAHNLFGSLTALQNVRMALELQNEGRRYIHERGIQVLKELKLEDKQIRSKPANLSGGQKQRVAIARALANRPKLILADEPTAALDEDNEWLVVNLLKKMAQQEGCTSLIVTHSTRILEVGDRIICMAKGCIKSNVLFQEVIEICEFLRQCEVFARLTTSALATIAEKMEQESHPAGTVIIRQGDEGDKFYLIKRGMVDVIVNRGEPDEMKVATLGKGQFFGETALMRDTKRNATVIAAQDVDLYTLDKPRFQAALAVSEPFRKELEKILFQRQ
jgi:putative ABC transport system ATP-binding protein